jgi:5-methylcytosine-specific restriction protein B
MDFTNVQTEEELKQLFIEKGFNSTDYSLIALKCLKFWMKKNDIVFISNGNSRVRAIGQIIGDYYFDADSEIRYKQFRPVKWLATDLDIPVEMVYEKRFSQQSIYAMYNSKIKKDFFQQDSQENQKLTPDNYVMIIDEINRGNVSQIFGELITLLEEDKRSGVENGMPLSLTLPYSKKSFSVPNNLYIIGTMNTADRSVEALDTALRRRFSFEEMPPCYDLEELEYEIVSSISANQFLKTINNRIEKLLDKDHLIGHSFLIKKVNEDALTKVMETFYKNIIPLLQEYFFGDYGKIGLILGSGFVKKKDDNEITFAKFEYDIETREMYEIINHRREPNLKQTFEEAIKILMNV